MLDDIIQRIERNNGIEETALAMHIPDPRAVYIIVLKDLKYKILSPERFGFNSKYSTLDYYSKILGMNKAVDRSKKITSNNKYTFFYKDASKITEKIIDNYFLAVDPDQKNESFKSFIKKNYREFMQYKKNAKELIKIFFLKDAYDCIENGKDYFKENCLSTQFTDKEKGGKENRDKGISIFLSYNHKKPFLKNKNRKVQLGSLDSVESAYKKKCLYDILDSLDKEGKNIIYILETGKIYALSWTEEPRLIEKNLLFLITARDKNKKVYIKDFDHIPQYSYLLSQ